MEESHTSAEEDVKATTKKRCSRCKLNKNLQDDFYRSTRGVYPACKKCVVKINMAYQRKTKAWLYRPVDREKARAYALDYYVKNKDKFRTYRKTFRSKNPEYHKMYMRRRKNEKPE